jgi:acetyl-CoA carboxylase biotin carboxyl carrier protein
MNKGSIMADTKSAMHIDAALVRQLAELLDETKLTEIEVEDGDRKIRVARNVTVAAAAPVIAAPAAATALNAEAPATPSSANAVKSPMVGTVYLSAEPGSKPFASVGDSIKEGETILIIEAMKVMNPIPAPRAGKVMQVLIENGQPVEFDQPLIVIE